MNYLQLYIQEDKQKLLVECQEVGVNPKEIDKAISDKETEIKAIVETIKGSLEQLDVISA